MQSEINHVRFLGDKDEVNTRHRRPGCPEQKPRCMCSIVIVSRVLCKISALSVIWAQFYRVRQIPTTQKY